MVAQDWMPPAGAQLSKLEPSDTGIFNTIKINSRAAATKMPVSLGWRHHVMHDVT